MLNAAGPSSGGVAGALENDPIPGQQICAHIKIAIVGGINEPRDAMNTTIYGLLTNADQLAQVKRVGDAMLAFEEGVLWVTPISAASRVVTEETEIRGYHIPKGDTVMPIKASANRDEDVVQDGEVLDVHRDGCPHQSFGNGPHFCQGTHAARRAVEQIKLPVLLDRFPNATLPDQDAVIWHGFGFRGPVTLPVRLN